ncbi:MAG: serine/threonine protein kinase [Lachnospiraceae bacterium]
MQQFDLQKLLGKNYIVKDKLGKGGMGTVFRIYCPRDRMYYAAKIILENDLSDGRSEAEIMCRLHHPMLPEVKATFCYDQFTIIIMEYIEGQTMEQFIRQRGPTSQKQAVKYLRQLADVLMYLHGMTPPVIYRDLKPANIMVEKNGNLRLIDFGTARSFKCENNTDTVALGTPGYAAPEQLMGSAQSDARTDIYALGATMYYIITGVDIGQPPFEAVPVHSLRTGIDAVLEGIVLRCLQKNPESRFNNLTELLYELDQGENLAQKRKRENFNPINIFISHSSKNILK